MTDHTGHGTFVAGLILDYAPDAELYVAKIADRDPSDPRVIAKVSLLAADVAHSILPHSHLLACTHRDSRFMSRPLLTPLMSGTST